MVWTTLEEQATQLLAMRPLDWPLNLAANTKRIEEINGIDSATFGGGWYQIKLQQSRLPREHAFVAPDRQSLPIKLTRSTIMSVTDVEVKGPGFSSEGKAPSATRKVLRNQIREGEGTH